MIDQVIGDVALIIVAGLAVASVVTPIYDHFSDDPAKRLAEFAGSLWKAAKMAFWIVVGVPAALLTLLICIEWPPMIIIVVIAGFLAVPLIGWASADRNQ